MRLPEAQYRFHSELMWQIKRIGLPANQLVLLDGAAILEEVQDSFLTPVQKMQSTCTTSSLLLKSHLIERDVSPTYDVVKRNGELRGAPAVGLRRARDDRSLRTDIMKKLFGCMLLLAMAAAGVAVCGSVAQASVNGDTISIAFARDEPPGTAGCALNATDVAGVPGYQSANWNNETTNMGTDTKLMRDTNGVATQISATLTWVADNTWSTDGTRGEFDNAFSGADEALMNGYLDAGNNAVQGFSEVTVKGLPADMAAGYSVIIYSLGGVLKRPAMFSVNGGNPQYILPGGPGGATSYYANGMLRTYVQAIGDDPTNGPDSYGNYLIFTGLTGDLDVQGFPNGGGTPRAALNAIQIVKNP